MLVALAVASITAWANLSLEHNRDAPIRSLRIDRPLHSPSVSGVALVDCTYSDVLICPP
jgi:hypothetical protein